MVELIRMSVKQFLTYTIRIDLHGRCPAWGVLRVVQGCWQQSPLTQDLGFYMHLQMGVMQSTGRAREEL